MGKSIGTTCLQPKPPGEEGILHICFGKTPCRKATLKKGQVS